MDQYHETRDGEADYMAGLDAWLEDVTEQTKRMGLPEETVADLIADFQEHRRLRLEVYRQSAR